MPIAVNAQINQSTASSTDASDLRARALSYHELLRPGKLQVLPSKPMESIDDLSLAYSPGVASACEAIAENEANLYRYTGKGNLVAVISNGTAVLGLGDIGPAAAKPVMKGKAALL